MPQNSRPATRTALPATNLGQSRAAIGLSASSWRSRRWIFRLFSLSHAFQPLHFASTPPANHHLPRRMLAIRAWISLTTTSPSDITMISKDRGQSTVPSIPCSHLSYSSHLIQGNSSCSTSSQIVEVEVLCDILQ